MGLGMLRTMGALMVVGLLCTSGCSLGGDAEAKKEASDDDDGKKKKKKKDEDEDADEESADSEPSEDSEAEVADNRSDTPPTQVYPYPTSTYKNDTPDAFGKSSIGDNKTGTTNTKSLTDKPDEKTAEKTAEKTETPPDNTGSGKKTATPGRGIPAPPGGRPRPGTK